MPVNPLLNLAPPPPVNQGVDSRQFRDWFYQVFSSTNANLGQLGTMALQNANNVAITGGTITGVNLGSVSLGTYVVPIVNGGTGANAALDARNNLGLGSIATQSAGNVSITGGQISGITDLAITDGGTGASNATDARTNLSAVWTGRTITAGGGLTGGGNLAANISFAIASDSNGYGTRYVSTSTPTGGNDGDIWYQI